MVLIITATVTHIARQSAAALWFLAAAIIYLVFGLFLTMAVNVPMNDALAVVTVSNRHRVCPGDLGKLFGTVAVLEPSSSHRFRYRSCFRRVRVDEIAANLPIGWMTALARFRTDQ
ncbi:anthrone oxygenase family protein [Chelativorans sp. M5D2P16]|uniref:anthrone oxygenase family protein n=1 Tax=Chelativorans sp. M5D2P16 TaxID=3095678 RepID=UPI003A0FC9DA